MTELERCPQCGCEVPDDAPRGLCPVCMLGMVLGAESNQISADSLRAASCRELGEGSDKGLRSTVESDFVQGQDEGTWQALRSFLARTEGFSDSTMNGDDLDGSHSGSDAPGSSLPVIPGYEILSKLGHGGMGVVFKARQTLLNRLVALKMIRGEARVQSDRLDRFRIEAEAVARLRHPNVVQIYDVGEVDGLPYFSLELLEGGSLEERMAGTPQPARPAAELLATLAWAVHAAHQAGIVHRDLKPRNILFDADGTPKITDFGLAKRLEIEGNLTATDQVIGTPNYMAPEQASGRNREIGPAADLYALGAILYGLLTGRPPFQGTTPLETVMLVTIQDPVPPSRLQPKVPRDLETICLKCLEKEPRQRYADAAALAEDLGRFLADEPIHARRTPAWECVLKWARRRPTTATLAAVGLMVLVSLVAGLLWHDASVRAEARREEGRVARRRLEAGDGLLNGQEQLARGELDEARVTLTRLLAGIQSEPRLADLRGRAAGVLDEVRRGLSERGAREANRARRARFAALRDASLFLDIQHPDLELGGRREEARASARAALATFMAGGENDAWSLAPLPASYSAAEREEVTSGCYLMLMVLAEAVARPLPGEDPRPQAAAALRILDRAAALRPPTRAYRIRRAACLERAGDAEAARRERAAAERLEPAGAFDRFLLGQECHQRGDWAAALRHFDAAIQEQPDLFWAQCLSAVCFLNSSPSRPGEAKAALTACLQQQPSFAWLYLLRGVAFGQMGRLDLTAAARLPARADALKVEAEAHFEAAEADFRKALDRGLVGDLRYALHMNRGVLRFQRRRLDEAVADFERAAALDPTRYHAFVSLASALSKQGRRDEALGRLDRAIVLKPNLAALYRDRALIRLDGGDPPPAAAEAALRDLDEAIRREPPDSRDAAGDHTRRARLLRGLGRDGEALIAADAAVAIAPDLAEPHRERVAALLELRRYGEVIDSCDAALAQGPPSAELYELRGLARVGRHDFAGAIADYTLALAARPDWAQVHAYRGWAYLFANAPELAFQDFDAVVRLAPSDPDGYGGRGAARVRLRQHSAAASDIEESLRHGEPTPRRLYNAARTYAQATVVAAAEVGRRGHVAWRAALAYETRAATLLGQALERTPADRRATFWREVVAADNALAALRQRTRGAALARMAAAPSP
jgi:eukaryotic-like serine/threonine-protein kinase